MLMYGIIKLKKNTVDNKYILERFSKEMCLGCLTCTQRDSPWDKSRNVQGALQGTLQAGVYTGFLIGCQQGGERAYQALRM